MDKLTGKLNNADYFLQLTRSMAEMTGQDTDEFLQKLYAKGKEQRERERGMLFDGSIPEGNSRNIDQQSTKKAATVDFKLSPAGGHHGDDTTNDGLDMEGHTGKPSKTTKKAWSELDKYIELLLDSK